MQPAILFHQAQELILLREQKRILRILNESAVTYYPLFPLWCFLEGALGERNPAQLKRAFRSVTLHAPREKENTLIFPVAIDLNGENPAEAAVAFAVQAHPLPAPPQIIPDASLYPIRCKTFRLTFVQKNGAATEAFSPVWITCRP